MKGQADVITISEIGDTGTGIPSQIPGKIFGPIFISKKRGSGFGLTVSARIIDQHGGWLEFDNRVRQGKIFRIMLPVGKKKPTT